ncbi:WXG100 family type VII secretion target [Rhodococcus triatomae]|uniref:WXG100 family type VII secretion target n=1 Tax=Rhodococcus triatomae TaxID=300028 RepID=UPI000935492C|nr:WXG100 family type VII secretion target [Rhodococcus triatomae]QNG22935.1 WXG100 family type VII secretion target [Rhodococcus triatomae]
MTSFAVDLERLAQIVDRAGELTRSVDQWLDDLDARVTRLHETWQGDAASAQLQAHLEWARGAQQMREALAALEVSAHTAHSNYTSAVSANLRMWS